MRITLKDIEENIKPLGGKLSYDKEFIFELLAAYGRAPANITRLRNGQLNVADDKACEVAQKGVVYLKPADVADDELYAIVDDLKTSPAVIRYSTRFVIATNYRKLLAIDTKTGEPLDINLKDIDRHYTYFLPWAGMEKTQFIAENHADVKAAEKMAKLFDTLVAHNNYKTADDWHGLTVFFTRLLFCFFAEDTGIFQKNQFVNAIGSYTQENGSDMHEFLLVLFEALDDEDKTGYPSHLAAFPYVNGNLFDKDSALIPKFNKDARNILIESSSKLDWSDINPDIFGSMFQAVVRPGERTGLGQHYTSVPNIMKTIEPLFLDVLKEEFDRAYNDSKKLEQLLGRISQIKIFDPACGSGNFLIIAYKELRKLEHATLERQGELAGHTQRVLFGSRINIENFYGIEIDDFAHEVAILSLWLAKHQMNIEFAEKFGVELPLIPLKEAGNIIHGNAARIDWDDVCPKTQGEEVYLISNPPYLGSKRQDKTQKKDIELNFQPITTKYKDLDYIAIWFYKGAKFISGTKSKLAFVSTNSISQGTQVEMIWPLLYNLNAEVAYTYNSFKWTNNAKGQAGVTCVIISLADKDNLPKDLYVFSNGITKRVEHINAYLTDGPDLIIGRRSKPLASMLPRMQLGNMAIDDGNFFFTRQERDNLVAKYPIMTNYLRRVYGSYEYINSVERYCLWVDDGDIPVVSQIPEIHSIAERVRKFRGESKDASTRKMANKPYQFRERHMSKHHTMVLPRVSSELRTYIPFGFLASANVITDLTQALYDAEPYILGLISSRMHMTWMRAVAGKLETRIRYSSAIVYNNFPVLPLREAEKQEIEKKVFTVLDVRENHPEKTLAQLYDPDKMPDDLRQAHEELDEVVDKVYRNKPFENDEERLAHLFDLYKTMTVKEKAI